MRSDTIKLRFETYITLSFSWNKSQRHVCKCKKYCTKLHFAALRRGAFPQICSAFLGSKFEFCKFRNWITKFIFPIRFGLLWICTNVNVCIIKCKFATTTLSISFLWRAHIPPIPCLFLWFISYIRNCKNQITPCNNYFYFCIYKCEFFTIKLQMALVRKGNIWSIQIIICRCKFCVWGCESGVATGPTSRVVDTAIPKNDSCR